MIQGTRVPAAKALYLPPLKGPLGWWVGGGWLRKRNVGTVVQRGRGAAQRVHFACIADDERCGGAGDVR